MDWRERCGNKLVSRDVAIMEVKSGFTVSVAPYTTTPYTLCTALMERAKSGSIENVRIDHLAGLFAWTDPDAKGAFELHDNYATPPNREACHAGDMEYLPVGLWKSYELPPGVSPEPDVFLVPVSPPNAAGVRDRWSLSSARSRGGLARPIPRCGSTRWPTTPPSSPRAAGHDFPTT